MPTRSVWGSVRTGLQALQPKIVRIRWRAKRVPFFCFFVGGAKGSGFIGLRVCANLGLVGQRPVSP